jgi:hypothetical protein
MPNVKHLPRTVAAAVLTGVAKVLRTGADALGGAAGVVRPQRSGGSGDRPSGTQPRDGGAGTAQDQPTGAQRQAEDQGGERSGSDLDITQRGRVVEPPTVPTMDVTHVSAPESHIAELASGTVAEIRRAVEELSTDDLRMLLEHETTHRKRKGVLDAVEEALTP